MSSRHADHLARLEAESIHVLREAAACFRKPVLLYSIGKDSSVLLHLARKALHPSQMAFPLLHIDTTFKFAEMIRFRDEQVRRHGVELIVHTNEEGVLAGINPFDHGSEVYTNIMKTEALKQALDAYGFDAAIGGARRDEEASRSKERIFSLREKGHAWNPKRQRPELWNAYNTSLRPGDTMRVFPLSNWTEFDVWRYIAREKIDVVPLYFAAPRLVVRRSNAWIMVDDDRLPLEVNESPSIKSVRFRTLGCYPLTGAVESSATCVEDILAELGQASLSERSARFIDNDRPSSMEEKKRTGYF